MYKVKVDHPNAGEQDIFIHGLGTFANGSETEVDDEQIARFRAMNSTQLTSSFDSTGKFAIHNVQQKSPEELNIFGVEITKVEDDTNNGEEGK